MTSAQAIESAVIAAIAEVAGGPIAQATSDSRLTDLGISSLLLFAFVRELELRLSFAIPDNDLRAENFATVGSVCRLLDGLSASAPTAGPRAS